MLTKAAPTGMIIDGCLSVETPDSSGEIVKLAGIDMSSFDIDSIYLNYEHVQPKDAEKEGAEKKEANGRELVGKLIYYKKIFTEDDCENDRQLMYFNKYNGVPILYGVFRLFDGAGHESAKALAAIIRDCVANDERIDLRFSVEGNTLDTDPRHKNILTDTIVRAIALTKRPCNKAATSGLLLDPNAPDGFSKNPNQDKEDNDILAGLLDNEKAEPHPMFRPIGSGVDVEINPLLVDATSRRSDLKKALGLLFKAKLVKAIMAETSLKKAELAKGLHGNWESEGYQIKHSVDGNDINVQAFDRSGNRVGEMDAGHSQAEPAYLYPSMVKVHPDHQRKGLGTAMYVRAEQVLGKPFKRGSYQSPEARSLWNQRQRPFGKSEELSKALTAGGGGMGAPSSLTGGAALAPENLRGLKGRALGAIRDYPKWKMFDKGEFKSFLKAQLPEVDDSFLDHFVHVASDFNLKRAALRAGLKKTELTKVGLTPESTASRMRPHKPFDSEVYDRVETYPAGPNPVRPEMPLYQHVYYQPPMAGGYQSVMHVLTPSPHPDPGNLDIWASTASGLHDVPHYRGDPYYFDRAKNLPWTEGKFIQHGETASNVRGRGIGTMLYRNMAKIHGRMTSDSSVSEGAEGVWRKLANDPELRVQLGPDKGHVHYAEHTGPKPQPLKVWEGDGRQLKDMLTGPSPYDVKFRKFSHKQPNDYMEAQVFHKPTGNRVGLVGLHVDPATQKLYRQARHKGGIYDVHYDHSSAGGVAMHAATKETGYPYGGEFWDEIPKPEMTKAEIPSPVICKLEALTIDLRKAAADLDAKEHEHKKVDFAGHRVTPGRATLADGDYELLHENESHYTARPKGKDDPEDLVRLPKAKEMTHYLVHSKPHVLVTDLGE